MVWKNLYERKNEYEKHELFGVRPTWFGCQALPTMSSVNLYWFHNLCKILFL